MMKSYLAYFLRIWPGDESEAAIWRASLDDPHTRDILSFDSLERMCSYLCSLSTNRKSSGRNATPKDPAPPAK